jgi:maltose/maltodextrin transport system substrate-binding protein
MKKIKYLFFFLFSIISINAYAKTLEIWTSSENVAKAIKSLTSEFEIKYKTKVLVTVLNKDLTTQFKTAALSKKGPDILCWAHDVAGELAGSGLIEPLVLPETLKNKFLPVSISSFTYQGKLYGYPYDIEAVAFIYNKKLLKKIPQSLEELKLISSKFPNSKEKKYGFLYDIKNFFFTFPLLSAQGGYIFKNENGFLNTNKIGLDNSGAISGLKFINGLVSDNIIPSSIDRSIAFEKMKKGLLAATIDGPWAIKDLKEANIEIGVAPIPTLGGMTPRPFVGTHGFMIRRSSKQKELAKEFIENYLVTKKGIHTLYKEDPRGPSRKDVMKELSENDEILQAFMASAKNGIPMPNIPQMCAVWGSMGDALLLSIKKKDSPENILKNAVNQIKTKIRP